MQGSRSTSQSDRTERPSRPRLTYWFLVGNEGMGCPEIRVYPRMSDRD